MYKLLLSKINSETINLAILAREQQTLQQEIEKLVVNV